jgi:threonine aldolase
VADIEREAITEPDVHWTQTKVICLENTLNGAIYPLPEVEQISEYARIHSIWTHMDGARLWHAAAETRLPISQWCRLVDSASLCLSKGIGAPVGSVLVGPSDFIRRCRHFRKLFGGGWRQSGPLAAMAEFALHRQFIDCQQGQVLRRVHENARRLGEELERTIPSLRVVPDCGGTNMLFVDIRRGNGAYVL